MSQDCAAEHYNDLVIEKPKLTNGKRRRLNRSSIMSIGMPIGGPPKVTDEIVVQEAKPMFEGASAMGDGTYDPLLIYLREIGQTPLLSLADERKLARKARKGDPRARELLILANLRLVVHIARGYSNKGLPMADLINEGNLGLMKSVGRFNPRKAKLSTYAAWWIKQHMMRALTNQIRSIRLPVHVVEQLTKLRRAEVVLQERLKREPTPEELAEVLGITARHVRRLITAAVTPTSLDAPIGEGETALAELIPDENALNPAESAERNANAKVIQKLMADLPPRERVILEYRFGFDGGKGTTLEEAGQRFGITRERIRQIQTKLLKQLRRSIEKLENHERNEILKGLKASTAA